MTEPITDDDLAKFIAWWSRIMAYHHKMRGTIYKNVKRHNELLEEIRCRLFQPEPSQGDLFSDSKR